MTNNADIIKVSVPLFIRLLEYAKEDAKTDLDLHKVAEKCIVANKVLDTYDYDSLVSSGNTLKSMRSK